MRYFAHTVTKTMLNQEWAMGIEEMVESEAQAQAICMVTKDFRRAFDAFADAVVSFLVVHGQGGVRFSDEL